MCTCSAHFEIAPELFLDKMRDGLAVDLGGETVPTRDQLGTQPRGVLDDAVVHHVHVPEAVDVGVCVVHGGRPVRGPPRVCPMATPLSGTPVCWATSSSRASIRPVLRSRRTLPSSVCTATPTES